MIVLDEFRVIAGVWVWHTPPTQIAQKNQVKTMTIR